MQVTPQLFKRAPDAAAMAAMDVADIQAIIQPIGLAPTKAKNLSNMSKVRCLPLPLRQMYRSCCSNQASLQASRATQRCMNAIAKQCVQMHQMHTYQCQCDRAAAACA